MRSKRFDGKKERIIHCATAIMNERGVRGMTLAEVASAAGMVPTSIAYYFGKKEALAAACFIAGLERLEPLVAAAMAGATVRERVTLLLNGYFALMGKIASGEEPHIPNFSDMRTLGEPWREEVRERYNAFFRRTRELLRGPELDWLRGRGAYARTNLIIEHMLWMNVWLPRHDIEEYPRLCQRMLDILLDGVALPGSAWSPRAIHLHEEGAEHEMPDALLIAATRLINEHGYKGASVDKISAALQRTKGAFYHHIDGKDDLVVAGFERTFAIIREAQNKGAALEGDVWTRLSSMVANLSDFQISAAGPLMRTSALQALPEPVRQTVLGRADRVARRFAGLIADGVAEGSLRAVDPNIAAQMLTAGVNAVADRRLAREDPDMERAPKQYAAPILYGVLCERITRAERAAA